MRGALCSAVVPGYFGSVVGVHMKPICAYLETWTDQQVFDTVAKHLLTQNVRAIDEYGCKYRGPNNTKCAAGCLIPDEEYTEELEDQGWGLFVNNTTGEAIPCSDAHYELISHLQHVHDEYPVCDWKRKLIDVANEHNLNYDVVNGTASNISGDQQSQGV